MLLRRKLVNNGHDQVANQAFGEPIDVSRAEVFQLAVAAVKLDLQGFSVGVEVELHDALKMNRQGRHVREILADTRKVNPDVLTN